MDICAGAALRTLVSLLKMYLPLYSGFFLVNVLLCYPIVSIYLFLL